MMVPLNFGTVVTGIFLVVLIFLAGVLYSRKYIPNGRAVSWEWLAPERPYRILFIMYAWSPQHAMIQDEKGLEEPFQVILPQDELVIYRPGRVVTKIMEGENPRLCVADPRVGKMIDIYV